MRIRIGTRGSALALWQARHTADLLSAAHPGLAVETVVLRTEGDRFADARLTASSGRGVFVREIEEAILAGTVDLGVHSLKDLPTETPSGLTITAILPRADARDAIVSPHARGIGDLRAGAVVATGSPRRRGQLLGTRKDLAFVDVRGNVDTRIRKLRAGEFDALVLAAAGLVRLGVDPTLWEAIPLETCLPAPGQGAVALEVRTADGPTRALLAAVDHRETASAVLAERAFLAAIEAGCLAPAGAFAAVEDGRLVLEAVVATTDGRTVLRERAVGSPDEPTALGWAVAEQILAAGGAAIVEASR